MSSLDEFQSLVDKHAQDGFFNHIQRACEDALSSNSGDLVIRFWKAYAIAEQGNSMEAIRELEPLQNQGEVALAVTACLINTHKECAMKDKEKLTTLKEDLKNLSKNVGFSLPMHAP